MDAALGVMEERRDKNVRNNYISWSACGVGNEIIFNYSLLIFLSHFSPKECRAAETVLHTQTFVLKTAL